MPCLSDENLAAVVDGSATDEQLSAWHDHIATCDSCAAKAMRRQAGVSDAPDGSDVVHSLRIPQSMGA